MGRMVVAVLQSSRALSKQFHIAIDVRFDLALAVEGEPQLLSLGDPVLISALMMTVHAGRFPRGRNVVHIS